MSKNLLILGAGQYGMFIRELAADVNRFSQLSFLDDRHAQAVGPLSDYLKFADTYSSAFVAIGDTEVRMRWIALLKEAGYEVETLIHPQAFVSPSAQLGLGVVVEPMAVVQSGAVIGEGSMIASGAVVKHNATVGSGCYIDCNSVVLPGAVVSNGERVFANIVMEAER